LNWVLARSQGNDATHDPAPIETGGDADREALSRDGGRPDAGEDGDGGAQRIGHLDTTERERTMR